MISNAARTASAPHLVIFESELQFITSNAAEWAGLETGGELYGLWSHAIRPVVLLATGPGTNATHQSAHFAQDIDYFRWANELLTEELGIQFLGDWHSHHFLGLDHPSGGDSAHIASIASRNDLLRMAEMILTCEGEVPGGFQIEAAELENEGPLLRSTLGKILKGRPGRRKSQGVRPGCAAAQRVNAHAFFYGDARKGLYEQCPIRVIRGMSPFRQALLRSSVLHPTRMSTYAFSLPLDRVSLHAVSPEKSPGRREVEIPPELVEQILQLPEIVKEGVETTVRDGLVVVTLPVPNGDRVAVAFDLAPPYAPQAAHLIHNGESEPIDLTEHAVGGRRAERLIGIYQRVAQLVAGIEADATRKCARSSAVHEQEHTGDHYRDEHRDCRMGDTGRSGEWRA